MSPSFSEEELLPLGLLDFFPTKGILVFWKTKK